MNDDALTRMENLLKSGVSADKVLQDMINYLRGDPVPQEADTSLEEMIDDFLDVGEKSEECFNTIEKIYYELHEGIFFGIKASYDYVRKKYSREFKDFDSTSINRIISGLDENNYYKSVILACAINYSYLDEIVISKNVSKLDELAYRFGENGINKKLIVEGDVGNNLGIKMSGGEIYVKGNVNENCGSGMSGGTIHIEGKASWSCGEDMYGGEITVDGEIVGPIGKNKIGGKIINKGKVY